MILPHERIEIDRRVGSGRMGGLDGGPGGESRQKKMQQNEKSGREGGGNRRLTQITLIE